jgi:NAD(P)-dependent dehydrogenase (short-subunit alcohol dehydrogenase family)
MTRAMAMNGIPRKDVTWHRAPVTSLDLKSLKAAIVGGTGGIGQALARLLASRGAQVTVVGQTFRDADVPGIRFEKADLSSMAEARRVARALPAEELDLVVLTTGIFAGPKREETPEKLERDLAVSYLCRLEVTRELAPRLGTKRPPGGAKPRLFVMGFPGADQKALLEDFNSEKSYSAMPAHMNTVAGNEALVLDAAKRYPNIGVFGLNPGLIKSNIRSNVLGGTGSWKFTLLEGVIGMLQPSAAQYAELIVPLLVSKDLEPLTGVMFNKKGTPILASKHYTPAHVEQVIAASEALLARARTLVP